MDVKERENLKFEYEEIEEIIDEEFEKIEDLDDFSYDFNKVKVYGICSERYRSSINDFINIGRYDVVPAVFISDGNKIKNFYYDTPFKIFEKNMDLELVKNIVSQYEKDINFLQDAKKSYKELTKVVNKNADKIIADIISTQIMMLIKEHNENNSDEQLIFFITNLSSDKIIGRLGYLFLDYSNVTIAFITYNSKHLMTNIINKNHLDFDLTYDFNSDNDSIVGNLDPDNNVQSMLSSFFYMISLEKGIKIAPLRIDILSQNLSFSDIKKKINLIKHYLNTPKNLAEPIIDNNTDDYVVRLPRALQHAVRAEENFRLKAENIINTRRYNDEDNRKSV